jgi:F420-dependent oxidoreductase-like protein
VSDAVVLPSPCLVVLVGAAGAGKSTWAAEQFTPEQIVSSDALRAIVGAGEDDITASDDAFSILDQIVEHRCRRDLTTVIDTVGLDPDRRAKWLGIARRHRISTACVIFTTPATECRARNRARKKTVPDKVLTGQARQVREQHEVLYDEGFDFVIEPAVVRIAPAHVAKTVELEARQTEAPVGMVFGLQIPAYTWPGGPHEMQWRLRSIARAAEDAGFASIWVMDHFRQIPSFGPAWDDMLESYTTLAFLAGVTEKVRLGTLVSGITHRNVALLGKIVASLDVLSGGRAVCGLGLGWFETEHKALGWPFPTVDERYALLEDALEFLPILWGKGTPAYAGRVLEVPEAMCYPRPLQEHIPLLVGGSGEKRTLRLVAKYADACNIIGEVDVVRRKVRILHDHCLDLGRDPENIAITQLSTTLIGRTGIEVAAQVERYKPRRVSSESYAKRVNAGTPGDQIGRFRALAEAGVQHAIVSFPDLANNEPIEHFAKVIAAFAE